MRPLVKDLPLLRRRHLVLGDVPVTAAVDKRPKPLRDLRRTSKVLFGASFSNGGLL